MQRKVWWFRGSCLKNIGKSQVFVFFGLGRNTREREKVTNIYFSSFRRLAYGVRALDEHAQRELLGYADLGDAPPCRERIVCSFHSSYANLGPVQPRANDQRLLTPVETQERERELTSIRRRSFSALY